MSATHTVLRPEITTQDPQTPWGQRQEHRRSGLPPVLIRVSYWSNKGNKGRESQGDKAQSVKTGSSEARRQGGAAWPRAPNVRRSTQAVRTGHSTLGAAERPGLTRQVSSRGCRAGPRVALRGPGATRGPGRRLTTPGCKPTAAPYPGVALQGVSRKGGSPEHTGPRVFAAAWRWMATSPPTLLHPQVP